MFQCLLLVGEIRQNGLLCFNILSGNHRKSLCQNGARKKSNNMVSGEDFPLPSGHQTWGAGKFAIYFNDFPSYKPPAHFHL